MVPADVRRVRLLGLDAGGAHRRAAMPGLRRRLRSDQACLQDVSERIPALGYHSQHAYVRKASPKFDANEEYLPSNT